MSFCSKSREKFDSKNFADVSQRATHQMNSNFKKMPGNDGHDRKAPEEILKRF